MYAYIYIYHNVCVVLYVKCISVTTPVYAVSTIYHLYHLPSIYQAIQCNTGHKHAAQRTKPYTSSSLRGTKLYTSTFIRGPPDSRFLILKRGTNHIFIQRYGRQLYSSSFPTCIRTHLLFPFLATWNLNFLDSICVVKNAFKDKDFTPHLAIPFMSSTKPKGSTMAEFLKT